MVAWFPAGVIISDNGGVTWDEAQILYGYEPSGQPTVIFRPTSDDVRGGFSAWSGPSLAVDPSNPSRIVIVFSAVEANSPNQDVDIYLAVGDVHPATGRLTFPADRVRRITDSELGDTNTDQIMPVATFDSFGGLNIMYYADNDADTSVRFTPKWARLTGNLLTAVPYAQPLGAEFDPLIPPFTEPDHAPLYRNAIAASGCNVYVAYVSTKDQAYSIYTNRISMCDADVDQDGLLSTQDVSHFNTSYIIQSPDADVNRDGCIDALDFAHFFHAYACGCGVP